MLSTEVTYLVAFIIRHHIANGLQIQVSPVLAGWADLELVSKITHIWTSPASAELQLLLLIL